MFTRQIITFLVINFTFNPFVTSNPAPDENNEPTLQLLHVLFRHGDRTANADIVYPKDPHINETYYPYGRGELTNKGKLKEYNLGKALRKKYGKFLGDLYTPDILEAYSSNTNRTKTSLQLVLAGLFPPVRDLVWETGLNWQPIPYNTLPTDQDRLFYGLFCPNFKKHFYEVLTSPRVLHELEANKEVFEYLTENTGKNITNYWDAIFLYLRLKTEKEFGLQLAEWTKKVFPHPLEEFAIRCYGLLSATTELTRLMSGYLLQKIIDDTKAKINGELIPQSRKIFLYSGHEFNVALLLKTMDVYKPHIPPYGSYIVFELHKINDVFGFKIYYQDYSSPEPQLLKLPACEEFCSLNKFILLLEEYLPNENSCS